MKLLLLWLALICPAVVAFAPIVQHPNHAVVQTTRPGTTAALAALSKFEQVQEELLEVASSSSTASSNKASRVAGLCTGLVTFASCAMAGDDIEMAELPPPYVPAGFAVLLLVGVGVLTGSLGNVIDEGKKRVCLFVCLERASFVGVGFLRVWYYRVA